MASVIYTLHYLWIGCLKTRYADISMVNWTYWKNFPEAIYELYFHSTQAQCNDTQLLQLWYFWISPTTDKTRKLRGVVLSGKWGGGVKMIKWQKQKFNLLEEKNKSLNNHSYIPLLYTTTSSGCALMTPCWRWLPIFLFSISCIALWDGRCR